MEQQERPDQEPELGEDVDLISTKPPNALDKVRRDLTDDELSSPGALKLLLDRLDLTEKQVVELREYRERFHQTDKQAAILAEKSKRHTAAEILYGLVLSVGSAIIGLTPSLCPVYSYWWLFGIAGAVLFIGAVIYRGLWK